MASRSHTTWDTIADGRAPVASELEAIFAPLPRLAPPAEVPASPEPAAARAHRPGLWFALLGAMVLAALIGSWALLMPVDHQEPPQPAAEATPAPPPVPSPTSNSAVAHLPRPPKAALAIQPKATRAARASHQPKVIPARAPHHPKVTSTPSPHKPKITSARAQQQTAPPPCPRSATEAWCLRGKVTAADTELRDAYGTAVQAGVDRHVLVDIRNNWKRLRKRANQDPQALISGYAVLTQQLYTAARGTQR